MNENLQEHLKLLRAASRGALPPQIAQDSAEFSYDALRELCDSGLMTATHFAAIVNKDKCFLNPKITLLGREYLAELEKLPVPDQAAQPANAKPPKGRKPGHEWHKNPFLIVGLIVIGGVLVVLVNFLIRNHFGIAL